MKDNSSPNKLEKKGGKNLYRHILRGMSFFNFLLHIKQEVGNLGILVNTDRQNPQKYLAAFKLHLMFHLDYIFHKFNNANGLLRHIITFFSKKNSATDSPQQLYGMQTDKCSQNLNNKAISAVKINFQRDQTRKWIILQSV